MTPNVLLLSYIPNPMGGGGKVSICVTHAGLELMQSSCLRLLNAGVTDVHSHGQLAFVLTVPLWQRCSRILKG